jgi:hypothetical protein
MAERTGADGDELVRTSRLTARVDNNAIGDGFQLYLHGFFASSSGEWAVVQQGMNEASAMARRYHWHSAFHPSNPKEGLLGTPASHPSNPKEGLLGTPASVRDFTTEPHTAIVGEHQGTIMNLVDRQARPAQSAMLALVREPPAAVLEEARRLTLPRRHEVLAADVDLKRLGAVLAVAHQQELRDFASLLLTEKVGPRTLQSLALVAEVIHGTPTRFSDPARFSFAHGGKDGHPFPVPLKVYDETIAVLRRSLARAKLQNTEMAGAFGRLDRLVRAVEDRLQPEARFEEAVAHERAISDSLDGRSTSVARRQAGETNSSKQAAPDHPKRQRIPRASSSQGLAGQLKLF